MLDSVLAAKGKMTQSFIEGRRVPVTKVVAGPCVVCQIKNMGKDGYWAVQLGFGERKAKNTSKALQGHLKKTQNLKLKTQIFPRYIREIRLEEEPKENVGETIKASDIFSRGDIISIVGTSKGKGFAGGVKRWHFAGGPRTHGQSDRERAPGSIGQTTTPGRVLKGKHMAGRLGNDRVTVENLQIVKVDPEKNEIEILGPVPGVTGGLLIIKRVAKGKLEGIHEVTAKAVEQENGQGAGTSEQSEPEASEPKNG
jgi:large subunit ribosomal protein L3